ncbi:MAG: hypothetical protein ABI467_16815 [Kofleriaceae bacterium]
MADPPLPNRRSIEPGIRFEVARVEPHTRYRTTVNLTYYLRAELLNASVNYELDHDGTLAHVITGRLQAGF